MAQFNNSEVIKAVYDKFHEDLTGLGRGIASTAIRHVEYDEVEDFFMVSIQIMNVEDFLINVEVSDEFKKSLKQSAQDLLEKTDNMIQLSGSASVNERIHIKLQGDESGSGRYTFTQVEHYSPLLLGDKVGQYQINLTNVSIKSQSNREVIQKWKEIKHSVAKQYNEILTNDVMNHITQRTVSIVSQTELSEDNQKTLRSHSEKLNNVKKLLWKWRDDINQMKDRQITTDPESSGDAVFFQHLCKYWKSNFQAATANVPNDIRNIPNTIKNDNNTRMALMKFTGAASKDIASTIVSLETTLMNYPHLIKTSQGNIQEAHKMGSEYLVAYISSLIEMVDSIEDALDTFLQ